MIDYGSLTDQSAIFGQKNFKCKVFEFDFDCFANTDFFGTHYVCTISN